MAVRVEHADMLQAIPRLVAEGVVCDAVVTDPPYHLTATQKRFGADNSAPAQHGKDGALARLSGGFMGQKWDGGDIAFRPETWATVATILRPGAFLVAFGGTRTYHRLVCAIEDAGFVIQDQIAWVFGSGFPKRRDMLKPAWESMVVARKVGGIAREIDIIGSQVARLRGALWSMLSASDAALFSTLDPAASLSGIQGFVPENADATASWPGSSLGQTDMSPCGLALLTSLSTASSWSDTLADASDPRNMSIIETVLSTTIDWLTLRSCLSEITPENIIQAHKTGRLSNASAGTAVGYFSAALKRLSATLELSALAPAILRLPLDCPAEAVSPAFEPIVLAYKPGGKRTLQVDECRIGTSDDMGDPARFIGIETHRTNGWDRPHKHNPDDMLARKQAAAERAQSLGRWPANLCHDGSEEVLGALPDAPGQRAAVRPWMGRKTNGVIFGSFIENSDCDPRGDGGSAARFFYSSKANAQDRWGSRHPTVKPVELIKWLVPLVTPSGGLVLDCFAGSGTTGVAAIATGRDCILIEQEDQYVADIRERLAFYEGGDRHSLSSKARHREPPAISGGLF